MFIHQRTGRQHAHTPGAVVTPARTASRTAEHTPAQEPHDAGNRLEARSIHSQSAPPARVAGIGRRLNEGPRVTGIAQLARTLQARTTRQTSGVAQRYKSVSAPGSYAVARDTAAGARQPFTLVSDQVSALPRPAGKPGLGMGYAATNPAHPPLLVADDDTLAINAQQGEPKEFYAQGGVVSAANTTLEDVGSPIRLATLGNKITLTGGVELLMVQPVIRDQPPPDADSFAVLAATICRDTAKEILGGGLTHARVGAGRTAVPIDTTGGQVVGGTHELAGALAAGPVATPVASGMLSEGRSEAVKAPPMTGKPYGLAAGSLAARTQPLGLNEFARAAIGEGYVTQSIGTEQGTDVDFTSGAAQQRAFVWGYHYSSVVAESADRRDQIAMENYARTQDWVVGRTALLAALRTTFAAAISGLTLAGKDHVQIGQILHVLETRSSASADEATEAYKRMFAERLKQTGAMWYFRMVGSAPGQSFHEQQDRSGYFANPLTMAVANLSLPGESAVMFEKGSSVLDAAAQAALTRFVRVLNGRVARGAQVRRVRVIGFASATGLGVTSGHLAMARAKSAARFLAGAGIDPAIVTTEATRAGTWGSAAGNRRVTVTAES